MRPLQTKCSKVRVKCIQSASRWIFLKVKHREALTATTLFFFFFLIRNFANFYEICINAALICHQSPLLRCRGSRCCVLLRHGQRGGLEGCTLLSFFFCTCVTVRSSPFLPFHFLPLLRTPPPSY